MAKIFTAPSRYIQGYDIMKDFGDYISHLGSKPFLIGGRTALSTIKERVTKSVSEKSMTCEFVEFTGHGTRSDATQLAKRASDFGADIIVGVGGGLVIDTAKAVAYEKDLWLVIVPTIASTDAPCSREALQYTEDHRLDREVILKRNPDVVIADSKIIAEAPTRFFVAGMGDALSTWIEAQTCQKSGAKNFAGGMATATGLTLAELAYDILLEYGLAAKSAVDQNAVTPAVEMVIEANTLLSSIGFENCGLGAAHSIAIALGTLEGVGDCLHGELVGFTTIANLILENYQSDEIDEVIDFCQAIGLPTTFEELGIKDKSQDKLLDAMGVVFREGSFIYNLSIEVTPQLVVDSLIAANAIGKSYQL
jgi:glycerol dehydrogenase